MEFFMSKSKSAVNEDIVETQDKNTAAKKKYIKPAIASEKLNSYGALCNGTTTGGRKASTTAPAFCGSTKRNS